MSQPTATKYRAPQGTLPYRPLQPYSPPFLLDIEQRAIIAEGLDWRAMGSDEAADLSEHVASRFNAEMERRGLGVRIGAARKHVEIYETWPGAGLAAVEALLPHGQPETWAARLFVAYTLVCSRSPVDEHSFRAYAKHEYDKRVRHRAVARGLKQLAAYRDQTLALQENQGQETMRDKRRQFARLMRGDSDLPQNAMLPIRSGRPHG